ncbi:hypothetical protein ACNQKP_14815 [Bdellovibrio bacteriovorus]|uniref:hypothetical protein n=1 Tax=Bdellovibrio bacteriovorus TaxID=959 RepID=UPI003AA96F74
MKKLVLISLLIMGIGMESAMARPHHRPRPEHGRGHGGHHGNSDFGDGVLAGLLLSTSALFLSDITANHSQAVYLHADQDAATFLAEGGEPTPALAQAMNYERDFLARAQVEASAELSDQEVAYLVMRRSESL